MAHVVAALRRAVSLYQWPIVCADNVKVKHVWAKESHGIRKVRIYMLKTIEVDVVKNCE